MREKAKVKNSKVYRSTVVYSGRALMKVLKVGDNTVYGKLAREVMEKGQDSPLKIRLTHLAKQISKIGYMGALLVSISYLFSVVVIENDYNLNLIFKTLSNFPNVWSFVACFNFKCNYYSCICSRRSTYDDYFSFII